MIRVRRLRAMTVLVTAATALVSVPRTLAAREDDRPPGIERSTSAGDESVIEAKRRFEEGERLYSLGEYARAIELFRRAYELSGAPALLFNIAQAHRLNGDCRQAIEIYRHFVWLTAESPSRDEAENHIAVLSTRCPAVVPAPTSAAPALTTKPETPARLHKEWPARVRWAGGLLGGGIVLGVTTGILYRWNDDRYHRWTAQDRTLAGSPPPNTSPATRIAAQDANDTLIQSIRAGRHRRRVARRALRSCRLWRSGRGDVAGTSFGASGRTGYRGAQLADNLALADESLRSRRESAGRSGEPRRPARRPGCEARRSSVDCEARSAL